MRGTRNSLRSVKERHEFKGCVQESLQQHAQASCVDVYVHQDIVRSIDGSNPGRGYGFFARRAIRRGSVILAEQPLLSPRPGSTLKNMDFLIKLALAVNPGAFMELAPRTSNSSLVDKYKRNAFMFAGYPAILFNGAIFNHSCTPNVHFAPNVEKTLMIFTTTRDILEGEELCDSYTTQCTSIGAAHIRLKSQYGFTCNCSQSQS